MRYRPEMQTTTDQRGLEHEIDRAIALAEKAGSPDVIGFAIVWLLKREPTWTSAHYAHWVSMRLRANETK
jgi:hypothetical protein